MAVSLDLSGGIAVIRIDEPSDTVLPQMRALLHAAGDARAVVLMVGRDLCGGDLKRLVRSSAAQREAVAASLRGVREELASLTVPVVAAIGGSACGGVAELAMACDLRVLASDSGLGRVTGDQVLVARRVTADEALRTGLVDRVVTPCAVLRTAVELADAAARVRPVGHPCRPDRACHPRRAPAGASGSPGCTPAG